MDDDSLTLMTVPLAGQVPAALLEAARGYAAAAISPNTARAYASDWRVFEAWCRRRSACHCPALPEVVGLFLSAAASGTDRLRKVSVATLERRLASIGWHHTRAGFILQRDDRAIAHVMAGIRRSHGRLPVRKEAVLSEDLIAMLGVLPLDLRGLRDRALLLLGFAGALRRSELVALDVGEDDDAAGWIERHDEGLVLKVRGKRGWREIPVSPGSSERTCPVTALDAWLRFGRIVHGPVFRAIAKGGRTVSADRLSDRSVADLVKRTALAAGLRPQVAEGKRGMLFSGHSLRAGLASSADVEEALVQRHLGHASVGMTRIYKRRRDLFRTNMTKAAGL
jgi:integrase